IDLDQPLTRRLIGTALWVGLTDSTHDMRTGRNQRDFAARLGLGERRLSRSRPPAILLLQGYAGVKAIDVAAPAQLGPGSEEGGGAGSDAVADGLAQFEAPAQTDHDACQHAVAGANRTSRLDRDRRETFGSFRGHK